MALCRACGSWESRTGSKWAEITWNDFLNAGPHHRAICRNYCGSFFPGPSPPLTTPLASPVLSVILKSHGHISLGIGWSLPGKANFRTEIVEFGHDGRAKLLPTPTSPQLWCGEENGGFLGTDGRCQTEFCLFKKFNPTCSQGFSFHGDVWQILFLANRRSLYLHKKRTLLFCYARWAPNIATKFRSRLNTLNWNSGFCARVLYEILGNAPQGFLETVWHNEGKML